MIGISIPTTLRDLGLVYSGGYAISVVEPTVVERVTIQSGLGITVSDQATIRDLTIVTTGTAISLGSGAILTLDRATLSGGQHAIRATQVGTKLTASNVLAFGTSNAALDFTFTEGSLEFVTITNSGAASTTAAGINCGNLTVSSSIIWTPGSSQVPVLGCSGRISSSIAGPISVVGAANTDPLFASPGTNDFRLSSGSPAKDLVEIGPALDFEGDARPMGPRFDIGADESP